MILGNVIGIGNTASVYEWNGGKVLKLFYHGYPRESVEREYNNARALTNMNFAKPRAYELITYEGRYGIVYDKVEGQSLLEQVMNTGKVKECAECMAMLHKQMLPYKVANVPYYKDFLKAHLPNSDLTIEKKNMILEMIDKLPDGDTLCHGDFHPGNIIISEDNTYIIDFMNICQGTYLYDVARTVYLVEFTPVPDEVPDQNMLLSLKRKLTDLYLERMEISREMIKDYLTVIAAVRKGECPNE